MKYIWLGIKDYCKDVWHDWLIHRLVNVYNEEIKDGYLWKEGNLWHYIQQRKAAKLLKEIKTLQKELKRKDVK